MSQPEEDAARARRKLAALAERVDPVMARLDAVMLRHRGQTTPAGAKRKQPEPHTRRPLSYLVILDQRRAEMRSESIRIYEEAMGELDKVAASLADAGELQDMQRSDGMEVETSHV